MLGGGGGGDSIPFRKNKTSRRISSVPECSQASRYNLPKEIKSILIQDLFVICVRQPSTLNSMAETLSSTKLAHALDVCSQEVRNKDRKQQDNHSSPKGCWKYARQQKRIVYIYYINYIRLAT